MPTELNFDKHKFALNLWAKDEIIQKNDKILKMLDQIQSRNGAQHIMVSWILLWWLSFKYLQSIEKKVRLDELICVLIKLFKEQNYDKSNIVFMEYILQTILEFGRLEHMNSLFEAITECNIPISISMKQYYFKCVDKEEEMKRSKHNVRSKKMSFIKEERKNSVSAIGFKDKDRERDRKFIESVKKSGKLRRRTFKSYEQRKNLLIEEVVSFEIPGKWSSWGKISDYEQIFQTIDNEGSFKWFFCGWDQILTLYVWIGYRNDIEDVKTSISYEWTLSSEVEIITNIKHLYDTSVHKNDNNSQKFDLMILREHREAVLWNWILFFQRYKLPYDFILPFEDWEQKYEYDKNNEFLIVKEVYDLKEI